MTKKRLKITSGVLALLCATSATCAFSACSDGPATGAPANTVSTRLELPRDEILPTACTGQENLAYVASVLDAQTQYHTYTYTRTDASLAVQHTYGYKDYKDGVMLSSDITYSDFVKTGTQACFVDGDVYVRYSETPNKNTTHLTAQWNEGEPVYYTGEQYLTAYGMLSTELSQYIINDETITDFEEVVDNGDGTYTQDFTFDPTAATYYSQYGMKKRGGLLAFPQFSLLEISFTFDARWKILSYDIHEVAKVCKPVWVDSISDSHVEYYYEQGDFDEEHYAFYENYFKAYVGNCTPSGGVGNEETALDSLTLLSSGFTQVLSGGQQFDINLTVGDAKLYGCVFLAVDIENVAESLNIRVSLGPTKGEQSFYFEYTNGEGNAYYRDDVALYFDVSTLKISIQQFTDWIEELTGSATEETEPDIGEAQQSSDTQTNEEGDVLSDLLSSFIVEETDNGADLSLKTDDLFGTGIGADIKMYFGVKGNKVTVYGISLSSLDYKSDRIKLKASIKPSVLPLISHNKSETSANLADYATDVYKMLSSETLKINLKLDGDDDKVKNKALKGIYLDCDVCIDARGLNVGADVYVSYTRGENKISAKISATYDYERDSDTYGCVYLSLSQLNGTETQLNLYCDVSEIVQGVQNLLKLGSAYASNLSTQSDDQTAFNVAQLVNGILCMDYSAVIGELYVGADALRLSVDVDCILDQLNIDVGVKLGSASLVFAPKSESDNGKLSLSLSGLGLFVDVYGGDDNFVVPDKNDYFDLIKVVNLATAAYGEVQNIVVAQDVYFTVDAVITVDGLSVGVEGSGEICWKQGRQTVALSLVLYLADGNSTGVADVTELKLVYDESLRNSGGAFVKMAVNDLGLEIYQEDIEYVSQSFGKIAQALESLFDGDAKNTVDDTLSATQTQTQVNAQTLETLLQDENTAIIFDWLFSVLSSNDWVNAINDCLNVEISNETFLLSFLSSVAVNIDLDVSDGLSFSYDVAEKNVPVTQADIFAKAGNDTLKNVILADFEEKLQDDSGSEVDKYNFYTTTQCEQAFTRLVYNYFFAVIENIDVTDVLGSNTYNVHFEIVGNNCNIPELQDVTVGADLYFTNVVEKGKKVSKLKEIDLAVKTTDAIVKINVVYQSNCFYIMLPQIQNIILSDFKVKASTDVLYDTIESVVGIITDTNLLSMLGGVSLPDVSGQLESFDLEADTLVKIISTLVAFDYADVFTCSRIDGFAYAEIDLDAFAKQLGSVPEYVLGKVCVKVNQTTHAISTEGVIDGKTWIALRSEITERRDYSYLDPDEYINTDFLPVLVEDAKNFMTDDEGQIYNTFTFSGNIKAKLVSLIDFNIDVSTLSVGVDEESGIYVSLLGNVQPAKLLGIEVVSGGIVGFAYSNGYITLARNVASSPEYRVMTLEYFIDNLFTASDASPLKWLLDVSDFGWDKIIANAVAGSVDISSGLSTPDSIYLYNSKTVEADTEILISDYVKGITVNVNGNDLTVYGDDANRQTICDKLGVNNNYYGMNLDAETITDGVLTQIYAAIMRDDEIGISGIKAKGAIASYVDFTVNLDKYAEGATVPYVSGSGSELYRKLSTADIMREVSALKMSESNVYYVYDEANASYVAYDHETSYAEGTKFYRACMDGVFTYDGSSFEKARNYAEGVEYYTFFVAPDFYKDVCERFVAARDAIEYKSNVSNSAGEIYDEIFGNYNSTDGSVDISKKLYSVNLTVYEVGGKKIEKSVKAGSTVYLYDNNFPVYDNAGGRIAYVDESGNLLGKQIVVSRDTVVYAQSFAPATITVYNNGLLFAEIKSFVGDDLPLAIDDYTMVSDALYIDGVTPVAAGDKVVGDTALYGEFVQTQVTVNCVVYTFDFNSKSYYVSGTVSGIHKYADANNVLVLENTVGAYKVTAIGESALACASTDPEKSIKNIIVPANITSVGKKAFADNVAIKSIVFLADSVHFDGKKSDSTLPLYGCSNTAEGKYTDLYVYYTQITTDGDDWGWYRYKDLYNFNIGDKSAIYGSYGGKRCGSGTWCYVKTENASSTVLEKVNDFIADISAEGLLTSGIYDCDAAQTALLQNVNAYTAEQFAYINGHDVSVTSQKDEFGTLVITVCVTDVMPWYEINVISRSGSVEISGEHVLNYDGKTYAKGEITLTATPKKGYEFASWGDGEVVDNPATFTVNGVSSYVANYVSNLVSVKVNSGVDFEYEGDAYNSGSVMLNIAKQNGVLYPQIPSAHGYVFAGWAKVVDGVLSFTELNDESAEYYAIWATTSVGSVSVSTSGNLPASTGDTFYAWYADSSFETKVNVIDVNSTVLYARQCYSFSFSISGGVDSGISNKKTYFYTGDSSNKIGEGVSCSKDGFVILEADEITVSACSGSDYDGWMISTEEWSTVVFAYEMTRSSWFGSWKKGSDYSLVPSFTSYIVNGNLSLEFTH